MKQKKELEMLDVEIKYFIGFDYYGVVFRRMFFQDIQKKIKQAFMEHGRFSVSIGEPGIYPWTSGQLMRWNGKDWEVAA